jgi:uncharacterized RDD family membrane protein YckC
MSDQAIQVPVGLTTDGLLAKRYLARLIDGILLAVVSAGITLFATDWLPSSVTRGMALLLTGLPVAAMWIGYEAILESSAWQATIGKRLLGLKVYDASGGRMPLGQASLRNLVKDGPFLLFGLLPGAQLLSVVWLICHLVVLHRSAVSQAIHDRAAATWVAAPEETLQLRIN